MAKLKKEIFLKNKKLFWNNGIQIHSSNLKQENNYYGEIKI